MKIKNLLKFNSKIFDTLESKCRKETKVGKIANLMLLITFRIFKIMKNGLVSSQKLKRNLTIQIKRVLHSDLSAPTDEALAPSRPWHFPCKADPAGPECLRILIIAELSIPQCKRYRVDQKVEALESSGHQVKAISFTDIEECWRNIAFADLVIFYRTPYWKPVQSIIEECRRLSIPSVYDIDDLVFDLEIYKTHPVFNSMKEDQIANFMKGAESYQKCLSACDHFIASTPTLFRYMRQFSSGQGWIIENALDQVSLDVAKISKFRGRPSDQKIYIGYGSGTKSHDEDFATVKGALHKILTKYPQARLVLFGFLNISEEFAQFTGRIERQPLLEAKHYLMRLAELDINLAPLKKGIFNDAKSNIKFLEAAASSVVTVASPSTSFQEIIRDGVNGFLAETEVEWFNALSKLIESAELRCKMGEAAMLDVLARYSPETTQKTLNMILNDLVPIRKITTRHKLLVVNCLYNPFSFGGATLVAERLAEELQSTYDVSIYTGNTLPELPDYAVFKYEVNGKTVYSMKQNFEKLISQDICDEKSEGVFRSILSETMPDIVHFHAIQGLSAKMLTICKSLGIATVVTMHDAWWFCSRQFMQTAEGKFCGQYAINYRVCGVCVDSLAAVSSRQSQLFEALLNADAILAPSKYQLEFIKANLPLVKNIFLNTNSLSIPAKILNRSSSKRTRFAYIGGINAEHKGYFFLREIFEAIKIGNYDLMLVDLNQKLSGQPTKYQSWKTSGNVYASAPFDKSNIEEFYSNIDVLLTPSQIPESFGLAVREAIARGVWVISTNAGALAEDVIEGVNGNIIPLGNLPAAVEVIEAAILIKPIGKISGFQDGFEQSNNLKNIYEALLAK